MKNYAITREKAASELWVSTRTIDRYVKWGKLSYKKIANKVLLAKEEIEALKNEFSALHQEFKSELISENSQTVSLSGDWNSNQSNIAVRADIDQAIEEKIDELEFIKIENGCASEDTIKTVKKTAHSTGKKY